MLYTLNELIKQLEYSLRQTPPNLVWLNAANIQPEATYYDAVQNIQAFLALSESPAFENHIANNPELSEKFWALYEAYREQVYAWSATAACTDVTCLFMFVSNKRTSVEPPIYLSDAPQLYTLDASLVDLNRETTRESLQRFLNENPQGQHCVAIEYGHGNTVADITERRKIAHQLRMNRLIDYVEQLRNDYNNTLSIPSLPQNDTQLIRLLEIIKNNTHKFTKIEFQENLDEEENNGETKVAFIREHFAQSVRIRQQGLTAFSTTASNYNVTEYFRKEPFSDRIARMLLKQMNRLKDKNNDIATDKATRLETLRETIFLQQKTSGLTNNPADYMNLITEWEKHNLLILSVNRNPSAALGLPKTVQKIAKICDFLTEEIEKNKSVDSLTEPLLGIQYYEIISKLSNRMEELRQEAEKKPKRADTRDLSTIPHEELILNPDELSRTELKIEDLKPLCKSLMALSLAERTAINVSNIIAEWEDKPKPSSAVKRRRSIFKADEGTTEKMVREIKEELNRQIESSPGKGRIAAI